jgi:hypothetical protein
MLARSFPVCTQHVVCVWLILALAGLTLEIGRHSVHHADDGEAAACVFAAVAGNAPVISAPSVVAAPPLAPVASVATAVACVDRSPLRLGTVEDRAPPHRLSA